MFSIISILFSSTIPNISFMSIYEDILDINLSTSASPVTELISLKIWLSISICFKSFAFAVFFILNNFSIIKSFVWGDNLWLFTLTFASSFLTQNSEYKIDCFGITSSLNKYVHLLVILLINISAVASTSTHSSKFQGLIASSLFLTIQANLLLSFFASGPT